MHLSLVTETPWIALPEFITPPTTPTDIYFGVVTDGMAPGGYGGDILVIGYDTTGMPDVDSVWVQVSLTVTDTGAILQVSPESFSYTGGWHYDTLFVWEAGGDTIPFTVYDYGVPWLTIDPAPNPDSMWYTPAAVTFYVHEDTLPAGYYYDTIFVYSPEAANFIDVPVQFTVPGNMPYVLLADPYMVQIYANMDGYQTPASVLILDHLDREVPFEFSILHGNAGVTVEPPYITPTEFSVHANITGPGLFTDSLIITPTSDSTSFDTLFVPIQVFVYPGGHLAEVITHPTEFNDTLEMGGISIENLGIEEVWYQQVPFHVSWLAPWMVVDPLGMQPYFTPLELSVVLSADSLAPGTYHDTIWVWPDTDGVSFEPAYVPVTLTVTGITFDVRTSPDWFDFTLLPGDSAIGAAFLVYETHGVELAYGTKVSNESEWLRLWPSVATAVIPTMPDSVYFDVVADGLEPGWYHDTIVVYDVDSSGWDSVYVPVSLTVDTTSQYTIDTEPSIFAWHLAPGDSLVDELVVFEQGGASIGFWVWNASNWLTLDTSEITPLMTPETIPVIVDAGTLPNGVYYDTIRVESPDAQNSTGLIAILTVGDTTAIEVVAEPDHFTFELSGADSAYGWITVYEAHGQSTSFYYATILGSEWLKIHYPVITVLPTTPDTVLFEVISTGLASGVYSDTIVIFDPLDDGQYWPDVKVPVVLFVDSGGIEIYVDTYPDYLNLAGPVGVGAWDSLMVFEVHGLSVPFRAINHEPWLRVEPPPPFMPPTPATLWVFADSIYEPGTYYDTILILPVDTPIGPWFPPVTVPVTYTVGSGIGGDSLFTTSGVALAGELAYQWVSCHLTQEVRGATVPLKIPDGVEVLDVHFDSLITEGWDYTIVDVKQDSGFVVVALANSWDAVLPPGYTTLFRISFIASADIPCNDGFSVRWDTTLSDDPSRQLKFADINHATFVPGFDYWRDSMLVIGAGGGDCDGEPGVDIGDLTFMIAYMFLGGPMSHSPNAFDVNADCIGPDIGDLTYLISYLYLFGGPPHCGCIYRGPDAATRTAAGIQARIWFEDGATMVELVTDRTLRGIQVELEGSGAHSATNLADDGFDLLQGSFDAVSRVALVDLDGGAMIDAGSHQILTFDGPVTIESIIVSDEDHEVLAASVSLENGTLVPVEFSLEQNYPNPFNPETEMIYSLPEAAHVTLVVYNVMGQKVATLVDEFQEAGEHHVTWNSQSDADESVASGVYLYRIDAGEHSATKKMMLLK
jgi:hypothetical protein